MKFRKTLCIIAMMICIMRNAQSEEPNIILIMADDMGQECLGTYGAKDYKTPNLDRLAEDGVKFNNCFATPLCSPSRVSIMTGKYNYRNYEEFLHINPDEITFGNLFRDAGYRTAIAGKWQLGKDASLPNHFGFDEHCLWQLTRLPSRYATPGLEVNGQPRDFKQKYGPDVCTEFVCKFIEENKHEKFLVYYPMILTHCPFEPTPKSADWNPDSPGSKTYKGKPKYFSDMVSHMDSIVARILKQLEASGVADKTLFLFTSDNGTDKPIVSKLDGRNVAGAKGKTIDDGCRVPLLALSPHLKGNNRVCNDLVDFSDFLPTLCDAAAISIPKDLKVDGVSFMSQIQGNPGRTKRDYVHIWYSRNGGPEGKEFVRGQSLKLYTDGRCFDVATDPLEQKPLKDAQLSKKQKHEKAVLAKGLKKFENARPSKFANWKKNQPQKNKRPK